MKLLHSIPVVETAYITKNNVLFHMGIDLYAINLDKNLYTKVGRGLCGYTQHNSMTALRFTELLYTNWNGDRVILMADQPSVENQMRFENIYDLALYGQCLNDSTKDESNGFCECCPRYRTLVR